MRVFLYALNKKPSPGSHTINNSITIELKAEAWIQEELLLYKQSHTHDEKLTESARMQAC